MMFEIADSWIQEQFKTVFLIIDFKVDIWI